MKQPINPSEDADAPRNAMEAKARRRQGHIDSFHMLTDSSIKEGLVPFSERKGTDRFCCFVFLATIATMVGLSIYGYVKGNTEILLAPIDGSNRICGFGEGMNPDYKYLYFGDVNPTTVEALFKSGVCVKECPS